MKIFPCIHPFFPKYAPVSTPSSYCIGYRGILITGPSYYPKSTLCNVEILKEDKHINKHNSCYNLWIGLVWRLFLRCLPDTLHWMKTALIDIWWEVLFLVPSLNVGRETSKQFFVGETGQQLRGVIAKSLFQRRKNCYSKRETRRLH